VKIRSFIAVEVPADVRAKLAAIQERLRQSGAEVRWVAPENIHLTLKFMGSVDEELMDDIITIMRESVAGLAAWTAEVKGVGSFPSARKPRVVWVGVADRDGQLDQIHRKLDRGLRRLGVAGESRRYHPHLTLGRVKSDTLNLVEAVDSLREMEVGSLSVESLTLFQSDLKPDGAVYTPRAKVAIGT
jgi:2'-5' RNA ligase